MNAIDTSPEACAARQARIDAAHTARLIRAQKLSDSRVLTRSAGLENAWELYAHMNNVVASLRSVCPIANEYAAKMLEVLTDMDTELNGDLPDPDDLPYSGRERGQFDTFTEGVKCGRTTA